VDRAELTCRPNGPQTTEQPTVGLDLAQCAIGPAPGIAAGA
jgi:hypothetical protein